MYQKIISVILGFFKKCIDIYSKILYTSKCVKKCTLSSVGQSNRLITGRSKVRILEGAPFIIFKWLNGQMAEWLKAADCKSVLVRVRWFESISAHQELSSILKRILLFLFLIKKMDSKRRIRKASCGRFSRRGLTNPSLPTKN